MKLHKMYLLKCKNFHHHYLTEFSSNFWKFYVIKLRLQLNGVNDTNAAVAWVRAMMAVILIIIQHKLIKASNLALLCLCCCWCRKFSELVLSEINKMFKVLNLSNRSRILALIIDTSQWSDLPAYYIQHQVDVFTYKWTTLEMNSLIRRFCSIIGKKLACW